MWFTTLLLAVLVALLVYWVRGRRYRQTLLKRLGVPGPEPGFLLGNMVKLLAGGTHHTFLTWRKTYGRTFGYYEGDLPVIVTSDLEIIKHVYVKEFSTFHSRKKALFNAAEESIVVARGANWKRLRAIVSPTFSARRMKQMSPEVNKCVDSLLELLEERARTGEAFDIMKDFQGLTLSIIALCGFGLDVDAVRDPDNVFLQKCRAVFGEIGNLSPGVKAAVLLVFFSPALRKPLRYWFPKKFSLQRDWFYNMAAAVINERRKNPTKKNDFIQLMLEAERRGHQQQQQEEEDLTSLEVNLKEDISDMSDNTQVSEEKEKKEEKSAGTTTTKGTMTLLEMQAQCMNFILAGYETTSTALSFTAYELAMHPDVQEKLQQELDEHLPDEDSQPDYLSVQKMPYLDMVFSEALRLHSIAQVVTTRECEGDLTLDSGLHIPRGAVVHVHMHAVHLDPDYWGPEDPEQFVPERFLPERRAARSSLAWLPFGAGPRNCVGMRFALMEAKVALARMLRRFTIVRAPETPVPLKVAPHGLVRPAEGVTVLLERRSS